MRLSYLWRGIPGHPVHPPLTDATIGIYTFATVDALADVLGISDAAATHGWWLALLVGLVATVPTALTGFLEWLELDHGTPARSTATLHGIVMVTASVFFLIAVVVGKASFDSGDISAAPLLLTLIGYGVLAGGGYLGGSLVFVHGLRVLRREELAGSASAPPEP